MESGQDEMRRLRPDDMRAMQHAVGVVIGSPAVGLHHARRIDLVGDDEAVQGFGGLVVERRL